MPSRARHHSTELDGLRLVALDNGHLSLGVLPTLGGKVISLRSRGGREWLWRPVGFRGYFPSPPGTAFQDGALGGWDECFPTVAPCEWGGRELPDHGSVWTAACDLDEEALERGAVVTSLDIPPFRFVRSLELHGASVIARYHLDNTGDRDERYLWAMHPLFALLPGDRLELGEGIRSQLPGDSWVDSLDFADGVPRASKDFAEVHGDAAAGIVSPGRGERLTIHWSAAENPILGLWLTRGGWHGHHHLALEPANARHDRLSDAVAHGGGTSIPTGATHQWQIVVSLS